MNLESGKQLRREVEISVVKYSFLLNLVLNIKAMLTSVGTNQPGHREVTAELSGAWQRASPELACPERALVPGASGASRCLRNEPSTFPRRGGRSCSWAGWEVVRASFGRPLCSLLSWPSLDGSFCKEYPLGKRSLV